MSQLTVEDLQAKLRDAEESANRFIRERDEWALEAANYKKMAVEANARNPTVLSLRMTIESLRDEIRLHKMQTNNAKLESKLLKAQVKLLKAKRDASTQQ